MQEIREQTLPAETLESAKRSSGLSLIIALRQLFNNNVNDECLSLPRQATPTDPTLHSALHCAWTQAIGLQCICIWRSSYSFNFMLQTDAD